MASRKFLVGAIGASCLVLAVASALVRAQQSGGGGASPSPAATGGKVAGLPAQPFPGWDQTSWDNHRRECDAAWTKFAAWQQMSETDRQTYPWTEEIEASSRDVSMRWKRRRRKNGRTSARTRRQPLPVPCPCSNCRRHRCLPSRHLLRAARLPPAPRPAALRMECSPPSPAGAAPRAPPRVSRRMSPPMSRPHKMWSS